MRPNLKDPTRLRYFINSYYNSQHDHRDQTEQASESIDKNSETNNKINVTSITNFPGNLQNKLKKVICFHHPSVLILSIID